MAAAILVIVIAGITGASGTWLSAATVLAGVEVAVFLGSGLKCPLTALAARYDPEGGATSDTFFPARITRWTLAVFGPLLALGLALLAARRFGAFG